MGPLLDVGKAPVAASLLLTSPLITPSTGEAEPRGSSCVLYHAYNTFCTIHIRNVLNATNEGASGVCRIDRWFNPSFYPSLCRISMARRRPHHREDPRPHHREDPTMTLPKVDPTMTLSPYIHGEKTSKAPEQASTGPDISSVGKGSRSC